MSAVTLSDAEVPVRHGGSLWQHFREHFAQERASALLVASIITIANLQFDWLRSLETYAFLTLGQLTSVSVAGGGAAHRAVIVEIDDAEFERMFKETTPFDRAQLANRLATIYTVKPDVVVIDLDISPAYQPFPAHAPKSPLPPLTDGERKLYELIKDQTRRGITTVLLEPFQPAGTKLRNWREAWKDFMTAEHPDRILFADGEVPVSYGVHSKLSTKEGSVVNVVQRLIHPGQRHHDERRLDPRQLLPAVATPTSNVAPAVTGAEKSAQLVAAAGTLTEIVKGPASRHPNTLERTQNLDELFQELSAAKGGKTAGLSSPEAR